MADVTDKLSDLTEEGVEELCHEAATGGYNAGFARCQEILEQCAKECGIKPRLIEKLMRSLDNGPRGQPAPKPLIVEARTDGTH